MSDDVDKDSFVLYRSEYGECWHREPMCATDPDVPPMLDAASSVFNELEMIRYGDLPEEDQLCGNCGSLSGVSDE